MFPMKWLAAPLLIAGSLVAIAQTTAPATTAPVGPVPASPVEGKTIASTPAEAPVAKALTADLAKRDPANAVHYEANLKAFQTSLQAIDKEIADVKKTYAGTEVTATEPVFGYMAEALGLKMLNYDFQVALMNDAEPSATQVAAFENSLKDGSAKILFYNSQVTDEATTRLLDIAKQNKVTVIGVTETEPAGQTIQTWFGGQIDAVQKALAARTQ